MSYLTLGLSLFLVVNTITAIITEQVWQIGVMKAVEALSGQVFRVYLSGVMLYIAVALVIVVPLSAVAVFKISTSLLMLFNMEAGPFQVSWSAVAAQLALGLLAPLIAALWPVTSGARITVREAFSSYGLSVPVGLIERALSQLRKLPPLVALTMSNTFRKKGRLALTLVALVGGGAIFMMVMSVQYSMVRTFDQFLETWNFDIMLGFEHPQRVRSVETLVKGFPGVEYAEMLQFWDTGVRRVDDEEGVDEESVQLMAVSKNGTAYRPVVTAGRYLVPEDDRSIVLNQGLAKDLGVSVADDLVIELNDEDTRWTIVGLLFDIDENQTNSIVWLDVLSRELNLSGRGSAMFVGTEVKGDDHLTSMTRDLREWLDARGKDVSFSLTASEAKTEGVSSMAVIIYLLGVVAILIAGVGSVGLSGALSINALERQKEIGVMRAIGASGRAVGGIFVGEGVLVGLISWLLAVPISLPLGWVFTNSIGGTI